MNRLKLTHGQCTKLHVGALLAVFMLTASLAHAQYGPDDEAETLEAMKPKVAVEEVKLPPMPKNEDLLTVDTGPTSRQSYALDTKSLTVNSNDHVVRYSVVSTSSSGAKNTSYEAIDCKSGEFRRYAYGTTDGKWLRARNDKWARISSMSQNQLHFVLNVHYFCQGGAVIGKEPDILRRIRYNQPLVIR